MSIYRGTLLRWYLTGGSPHTLVGFSREDAIELSYSPQTVEPTKSSSSLLPEILAGTGTVECTGSFSGSVDSTEVGTLQDIRDALYTGAVVGLKCITGVDTVSGNFVITAFSLSGAREGSQEWNVSVRAAGALSFT
jgi:predicted secreted protein